MSSLNFAHERTVSTVDDIKLALDVTEAARAVSLSPWTIRKWISTGKIKAIHLGRRVMVEPSELKRLVELGRKLKNHNTE
jgi:excisionase family DNA binding protein